MMDAALGQAGPPSHMQHSTSLGQGGLQQGGVTASREERGEVGCRRSREQEGERRKKWFRVGH